MYDGGETMIDIFPMVKEIEFKEIVDFDVDMEDIDEILRDMDEFIKELELLLSRL